MPRITESIGDIFDAPPNSVLIRTYPSPIQRFPSPSLMTTQHPSASRPLTDLSRCLQLPRLVGRGRRSRVQKTRKTLPSPHPSPFPHINAPEPLSPQRSSPKPTPSTTPNATPRPRPSTTAPSSAHPSSSRRKTKTSPRPLREATGSPASSPRCTTAPKSPRPT